MFIYKVDFKTFGYCQLYFFSRAQLRTQISVNRDLHIYSYQEHRKVDLSGSETLASIYLISNLMLELPSRNLFSFDSNFIESSHRSPRLPKYKVVNPRTYRTLETLHRQSTYNLLQLTYLSKNELKLP